MEVEIDKSIKLIEEQYTNPEDDDGFSKWMAEDDRIKPTAPETKQTLFRVPTPRANARRLSTPRSNNNNNANQQNNSRPLSRDSVQTVISSEGNPDESSEDFLAMDPLAAQALKDLKQALGLAVQVEDFMSAATLKKIEPKIRKIGEALAVQHAQKIKAIENEDYDAAETFHKKLLLGRETLKQQLRL